MQDLAATVQGQARAGAAGGVDAFDEAALQHALDLQLKLALEVAVRQPELRELMPAALEQLVACVQQLVGYAKVAAGADSAPIRVLREVLKSLERSEARSRLADREAGAANGLKVEAERRAQELLAELEKARAEAKSERARAISAEAEVRQLEGQLLQTENMLAEAQKELSPDLDVLLEDVEVRLEDGSAAEKRGTGLLGAMAAAHAANFREASVLTEVSEAVVLNVEQAPPRAESPKKKRGKSAKGGKKKKK